MKKRWCSPRTFSVAWAKNQKKEVIDIVKKLLDARGFNQGLTLSVQSLDLDVLENIRRKNMEMNKLNEVFYWIASQMTFWLVLPLLCAIFDVVGIYGGWLVGVKLLGVNPGAYFYEMEKAVVWRDVYSGMIKSFSFGVIIAWVSCYKGYYAGHGAEGVSKATTESVVLTSVLILIWDYFLTSVLL